MFFVKKQLDILLFSFKIVQLYIKKQILIMLFFCLYGYVKVVHSVN